MNYKFYTVSVTDRHDSQTSTRAYFKANVAYSEFKRIVEQRKYLYKNCIVRQGDSLLIAESLGEDFLIELYEHELLKYI